MTNFEEIDYSKVTRQELIDNPHIRPYYLEWMLSYFFGETKLILSDTEGKIRFLELTTKPNNQLSTIFNLAELNKMSYDEFMKRFWLVVCMVDEYASKKSRP
jgi:hypothetical protein